MATKSPVVATLSGHCDSVCCCEILAPRKLLISGGEDGLICLADLSSQTSVGAVHQSAGEAVTALCPSPLDEHTVYAAAGKAVLALDLRKGLDSTALLGSAAVNVEEVNALAATMASGGWLAAGDDAGEVAVLSLPSLSEALASSSGAGGSSGRPSKPQYKTLRRGHANICSAVAFRPHRPGELLSGGLDSRLLRWDFARLRPLQAWDLGGEAAASGGERCACSATVLSTV